jgi:hypothetical protein
MPVKAVLLDWRGTLAMQPLPHPRKHSWWAIERPMTEALSPSG